MPVTPSGNMVNINSGTFNAQGPCLVPHGSDVVRAKDGNSTLACTR